MTACSSAGFIRAWVACTFASHPRGTLTLAPEMSSARRQPCVGGAPSGRSITRNSVVSCGKKALAQRQCRRAPSPSTQRGRQGRRPHRQVHSLHLSQRVLLGPERGREGFYPVHLLSAKPKLQSVARTHDRGWSGHRPSPPECTPRGVLGRPSGGGTPVREGTGAGRAY